MTESSPSDPKPAPTRSPDEASPDDAPANAPTAPDDEPRRVSGRWRDYFLRLLGLE
jgi:hypothetical protein